jgi:hypothetical protein
MGQKDVQQQILYHSKDGVSGDENTISWRKLKKNFRKCDLNLKKLYNAEGVKTSELCVKKGHQNLVRLSL